MPAKSRPKTGTKSAWVDKRLQGFSDQLATFFARAASSWPICSKDLESILVATSEDS